MASLSPENGFAAALNQLAIFKCELLHVSRSLDAERDRLRAVFLFVLTVCSFAAAR
jgi:hypothetical protein